jgi:hypothetical protein
MKFENVMYDLMRCNPIRRASWNNRDYVCYNHASMAFFLHTDDEKIKLEGFTLYTDWMSADDWMVIR